MDQYQDPLDLEAEPERAREKAQREAAASAREADDWMWLMDTPRGRRIVWSLLEKTGVYRTSFSPASDSQTAFNEGQRNVGLVIVTAIMQHTPDLFVIMQKEAAE